jgi:Rieske [2Fe-2S] domain
MIESPSEAGVPGTWSRTTVWETDYLQALRPFYHAVATVEELDAVGTDDYGTPKVLGKELLGQRIVLARLGGEVVALNGTCPHRGADLGLG